MRPPERQLRLELRSLTTFRLERMRIGVLGAGAVGGTLAALLARAGHDVEVTARGAHLEAIRRDGIRLDGGWGEHTAHGASRRDR